MDVKGNMRNSMSILPCVDIAHIMDIFLSNVVGIVNSDIGSKVYIRVSISTHYINILRVVGVGMNNILLGPSIKKGEIVFRNFDEDKKDAEALGCIFYVVFEIEVRVRTI